MIAIRRITEDKSTRQNHRLTNNSRIAALSRFLPFLRDTKIIGLEPTLTAFIRGVQLVDLQARETYLRRWVTGHVLRKARTHNFHCEVNINQVIVGICEMSVPVLTLGSYMASEHYSEKAPTTATFPPLAIATLLIVPMMGLPQNFLDLSPTITSFQAIRNFLLLEEHMDTRLTGPETASTALERKGSSSDDTPNDVAFLTGPFVCLFFSHLSVYSAKEGKHILNNISGFFLASQLNMIIGPVACGKSVLLSILLGETNAVGIVHLMKKYRTAYCAQIPWIPNTTIRNCIIGVYRYNKPWYVKVVKACDLDLDLAQLVDGDQSMTGSGGSLLSGGQKQRIVCDGRKPPFHTKLLMSLSRH